MTIFILLDVLFRKAFALKKISFPSQLGGCCIFFAMMVVAEFIIPGSGESIFRALSPGAGLLAKGLPVFFVHGLAMLLLFSNDTRTNYFPNGVRKVEH